MEKANIKKSVSEHYGCDFFFGKCDISCGSTPLSLGEDMDLHARENILTAWVDTFKKDSKLC